jgi:hypothetical protein
MSEAKKYNISGQHGAEEFRTLPEGVTITLINGSSGKVIANPGDGGYVLVEWLEHTQDPSKVGQEEYVFFNEVRSAEG